MKELIKDDFKRVLKGYRFWTVVSVILISTVINLLTSFSFDHTKSIGAINLFIYGNVQSNPILSITAPFLATFIFSTSINDDIKSSIFNSYLSKISLKKYIAGRAVSTALAAGVAFILAFILILVGCYIYDPSYGGNIFKPIGIFNEVYNYSVELYIILFIVHSSLVVSIYALFGMGLATLTRNNFIVLVLPGIVYYCSEYISAIINKTIFAFFTVSFPFLTYETSSIGMPLWMNMLQIGTILCTDVLLILIGHRRLKKASM